MKTILAALAGLLLLPVAPAPGEEAEKSPGVITLSDGTVLEGPIRTTAGKPLRLFEAETGQRLEVAVSEIYRIEVVVESEEQYDKWRWVEDGSREKVYTGESYPKRSYSTEVTLRNGVVHRGGIVAVLYVYPEGAAKPKKVFLKKKEQGEIGETLKDLVYVESIQFLGAAPESGGGLAGIELMVSPPTALEEAHAIPRNRIRSVPGTYGMVPGLAYFVGVLPGTYDLAVVTPDAIHLALAVGKEGGKPLTPEEHDEVQSRVNDIADFFEVRKVVRGVREGDRIRVVVLKTRTGPTSMGGKRTFRRFEVWSMHRGGDRWLVDGRAYLWREHGEQLPPPRKVILNEKLAGVRVESGIVEMSFAVPGKDER